MIEKNGRILHPAFHLISEGKLRELIRCLSMSLISIVILEVNQEHDLFFDILQVFF